MKWIIDIELLEIEEGNFHILVNSVFADDSPGKWVIDTGASKTVFDKNLKEKYKSGSVGKEELYSATPNENRVFAETAFINDVSFGKCSVKKLKVVLLDLSHVNSVYSANTNQKICGLLGSDFLTKYKATINFKKLKLILHSR